jgi:hypothetical protein
MNYLLNNPDMAYISTCTITIYGEDGKVIEVKEADYKDGVWSFTVPSATSTVKIVSVNVGCTSKLNKKGSKFKPTTLDKLQQSINSKHDSIR